MDVDNNNLNETLNLLKQSDPLPVLYLDISNFDLSALSKSNESDDSTSTSSSEFLIDEPATKTKRKYSYVKRIKNENKKPYISQRIPIKGGEAFTIPKSVLNKMTLEQFEEWVEKKEKHMLLNVFQNEEVNRQRKLIKNRLFSKKAREKKKLKEKELQTKLNSLQKENNSLREKIKELEDKILFKSRL